jgi:1-acyl-sn-glycerol-3-phosphate acyltransferase
MPEARIIPIKPAAGPDGEPAAPKPARRRPAKSQATGAQSAAEPQDAPATEAKPAVDGRRRATAAKSGAAAKPGAASKLGAKSKRADADRPRPTDADRTNPTEATRAEPAAGKPQAGKTRRPAVTRAAAEPPAAPDSPTSRPDTDRSSVAPPEELRDLGTFVTGKHPEPARTEPAEQQHSEPAGQPSPTAEGGQVWPNSNGRAQPAAEPAESPEPAPSQRTGDEWERKVAGALAFVRRRLTGEYEVDDFGFDAELTTNVIAAPLRPIYEKWFRVEVSGLENVPDEGAALIVANHSGVIALDGAVTALALLDHHPAHRHLRMLGADLVFKTPFLGEIARKSGQTLACNADAERLLSSGELVGVYPEGFKGVGKPFSERYKLQRFGRGGFVSAALRTKAPIIPCSIVGAEEIYPMLGNAKLLARLLGVPYFPLTPTFPWLGPLGMIPLPSKWYIEFGEPIETASLADRADDPMLTFNVADQVRETIQQTLYRLLMKRKSVFS